MKTFYWILAGLLLAGVATQAAEPRPAPKQWTFLVYLNGHSNLDGWSLEDMLEMEKVGTTDQVNVVVQWAYLPRKRVQRFLITRSSDGTRVTSPMIEDLGLVDMGDWHTLVDFIRWGVENFPAQKYFVDVWAHGTGWNKRLAHGGTFSPLDISKDDLTGTAITTQQLALAMAEAQKIMGHKVDLYASDACMMAMAEVAAEMSDHVEIYAGSELDIPVRGWPYEALLRRWNERPEMGPAELASVLGEEYIALFYSEPKKKGATWSVWDVSRFDRFYAAVSQLGRELVGLSQGDRKSAIEAAIQGLDFSGDSSDLLDFVDQLEGGFLQIKLETVIVGRERHQADQVDVAEAGRECFAYGVALFDRGIQALDPAQLSEPSDDGGAFGVLGQAPGEDRARQMHAQPLELGGFALSSGAQRRMMRSHDRQDVFGEALASLARAKQHSGEAAVGQLGVELERLARQLNLVRDVFGQIGVVPSAGADRVGEGLEFAHPLALVHLMRAVNGLE
jgi:hypothetical protein